MKYIVTSDIHLGHSKTPTKHIITSFKTNILTEKNKDADILFISGDLFDQLLDFNSKEVQLILEFFNYLLSYCSTNGILLRVLYGTPSHDMGQSQTLVKLNELRSVPCDLIYHNVLDIEYIPSLNVHVLYVPDEWTNSHAELEKQIQEKLHQYNITQVDIAILHGQFNYQLVGKKYSGFHFEENYFLHLVRGFIHVGHYHLYSTFDRIIANGSLERLAHGEEAPKGYLVVNGKVPSFIENPQAYIYKTINCTLSTTVEKLDKQIAKYPKESYIRLLVSKDHPFNLTYPELKLRYLDYRLKKLVKSEASEDSAITYIITDDELVYSDSFVLENNVHQTLLDLIHSKYSLNSDENAKLLGYISIFKEPSHEPVTAQ